MELLGAPFPQLPLDSGLPKQHPPPIGGMTWSRSFMLVLFQIFLMMALSSSLACSKLPTSKRKVGVTPKASKPSQFHFIRPVLSESLREPFMHTINTGQGVLLWQALSWALALGVGRGSSTLESCPYSQQALAASAWSVCP